MDKKAKHIEYMVQFAHSVQLKQEFGLEIFQPSQQKLAENQQQAEVKQANIEPAGLHLKIQKGQVKQMEEENQRTGTELKKKRTQMLKVQQDIEAFLSLSRYQKKCQVQKQNLLPEPFFYIPDELLVELE